MRSPFAIFRKYQKTAMVVLTVLAMFAFVVLDSISQMQGQLPPIMVVLILAPLIAGVGWLLGLRSGNGKEYALVGAALGAVGGVVLTQLSQPAPAIETHVKDISQEELGELIRRRQLANQFMYEAIRRSLGDSPMIGYYAQRWQFRFGGTPEQDVGLAQVYTYEADELDIEVPDEAVNAYIDQATQNKLSATDFREIRNQMRLSESELFNILREQLRARRAVEFLTPRLIPTPEEYWQLYRKLHVRESLEAAAVPVAQFESEVPEPSESDLVAFFEQYKSVYPNPRIVDSTPAFGELRKVRVGYLEADYDTFAQKVDEVTDVEIEAFYEENKELYRNNPLPQDTQPSPEAGESNPLDPEFTPDPGSEPDSTEPQTDDASGPADDSAESSANEPADAKDSTVTDSGLEEEEQDNGAETDRAPVEAPRPAASEAPASDEQPAPTTAEDAPADMSADDEASTEPLPEFQPLDEELIEEIRDQLLNERTQQVMRDEIDAAYAFMYSLSDAYHSEMFEQQEGQDDQADSQPSQPSEAQREEIKGQMQKYAAEHDLKYVDTGLVSAAELMDPDAPESLSIGAATEPVESEIERADARDVISQLFGDNSERLYMPFKAESFGGGKRYAYWKTADVPPREPNFDEPGIKEEVLAAWKHKEARPLAQKRAEELAEAVRQGTQGLSAALGGKTVTGKEGGESLPIVETEQFSWLRLPAAPQLNPLSTPPAPQLSQITGIEYPGADFMTTVFNQLGEGDVGVAPNADQSVYYVVMVKNRSPSTEGGEEALRQGFLRENLFANQFMGMSPYATVMNEERQQAHDRWVRAVTEMYGLKLNVTLPEDR